MFHPRIMFNVTEAKGEPRSKASYHGLCFQFSIFTECYNESLLIVPQQGAVDVQPNLFRRPTEDVVSFSLLIPPSLFFCLPLVPEKSFCLLGFAYDKSLYCTFLLYVDRLVILDEGSCSCYPCHIYTPSRKYSHYID